MEGVRYCSSPMVVIVTRVAAAPKHSSGIAVTTPVVITSATWPAPSEPTAAASCDINQAMYPAATGASTMVSTERLSTAPAFAFFFISP